jgi:hypothetical protein
MLLGVEEEPLIMPIHHFPLSYDGDFRDIGTKGTGKIDNNIDNKYDNDHYVRFEWDPVEEKYINAQSTNTDAAVVTKIRAGLVLNQAINNVTVMFGLKPKQYVNEYITWWCFKYGFSSIYANSSQIGFATRRTPGYPTSILPGETAVFTVRYYVDSTGRRLQDVFRNAEMIQNGGSIGVYPNQANQEIVYFGNCSSASYGSGWMWDFMIFDKCLTDAEIKYYVMEILSHRATPPGTVNISGKKKEA